MLPGDVQVAQFVEQFTQQIRAICAEELGLTFVQQAEIIFAVPGTQSVFIDQGTTRILADDLVQIEATWRGSTQ